MADTEQNKQTVIAFYERAFNDQEPEGASRSTSVRGTSSTIHRRPMERTHSLRLSGALG